MASHLPRLPRNPPAREDIAVSDLPILFSGPMVRAILREIAQPGTGKTQTRRVLRGHWQQSLEGHDEVLTWFAPAEVPAHGIPNQWAQSGIWVRKHGPRGYNRHLGYTAYRPGDRLYVREAWRTDTALDHIRPGLLLSGNAPIFYEADIGGELNGATGKFRQAMHMPRWASRITLIVTDVRVQRLQEISEDDAIAEGCKPDDQSLNPNEIGPARSIFEALWNSLNADRAPWASNPWVASYTFRPILGNIDQLANPEPGA